MGTCAGAIRGHDRIGVARARGGAAHDRPARGASVAGGAARPGDAVRGPGGGGVGGAALTAGCQVLAVPRAIEMVGVQPRLVWRREQPLIELSAPSLKGWQLVLKRAVDLSGATISLLIVSPLMALLVLAVKLDSR